MTTPMKLERLPGGVLRCPCCRAEATPPTKIAHTDACFYVARVRQVLVRALDAGLLDADGRLVD